MKLAGSSFAFIVFALTVSVFAFSNDSLAQSVTVKQDGSGDYTSIQQAIDAINEGDILVYPGLYYENIDFNGKNNITLRGLFSVTPQDSLIHQTIIDGSNGGSCISIANGEQDIEINGFTIQNGKGLNSFGLVTNGGGVCIKEGTAEILHCIIKNNFATSAGGGLYVVHGNVFVSGNTIKNNHAYGSGGGIFLNGNSTIVFDTIILNNMYLNYAGWGSDYAQNMLVGNNTIILDTATVENPNRYYFSSIDGWGFQNEKIQYEVLHGKIEQVNGDLYVNPEGNDNNSGLTPEYPLKTIAYASLKMRSDSTRINTIFLGPGTYSQTSNDEKFQMNFKNYVHIVGAGMDTTILDIENTFNSFGITKSGSKHVKLKDMTLSGSYNDDQIGPLWFRINEYASLHNVRITDCLNEQVGALLIERTDTVYLKNCIFDNNTAQRTLNYYSNPDHPGEDAYFEMNSCRVSNNLPHYNGWDDLLQLPLEAGGFQNSHPKALIINSEFVSNIDSLYGSPYPACVGIMFDNRIKGYVVNSTFGNNTTSNAVGGALSGYEQAQIFVYNSVFYGNHPSQIAFTSPATNNEIELFVYNSLVQDGEDGILNLNPNNYIYYDSTNINADPLWDSLSEYPYSLTANSPCIDAGTMELPDWITLPEKDLAGRPRLTGLSLDMGAYEYDPSIGVPQHIRRNNDCELHAFPNPFRYSTKIHYKTSKAGQVFLGVYNSNGVMLKQFVNSDEPPGTGDLYWNGESNTGISCPAGTYYLVLMVDGEVMDKRVLVINK